jgi:hypothetical protein
VLGARCAVLDAGAWCSVQCAVRVRVRVRGAGAWCGCVVRVRGASAWCECVCGLQDAGCRTRGAGRGVQDAGRRTRGAGRGGPDAVGRSHCTVRGLGGVETRHGARSTQTEHRYRAPARSTEHPAGQSYFGRSASSGASPAGVGAEGGSLRRSDWRNFKFAFMARRQSCDISRASSAEK